MNAILLDTCAVIWTGENEKMASAAVAELDQSHDRSEPVYVSAITAWELGILGSRGRYRFTMPVTDWFDLYMERSRSSLADLSPNTLIASSFLPGNPPNDPADRIIIATARQHGYRIMTRDEKVLKYANEGHVQAIAC